LAAISRVRQLLVVEVSALLGQHLILDVQLFSENDESGLIADLREVLADPALAERVTPGEIRNLVANMPAIGRALVAFHRRHRNVAEQAQAMMAGLGLGDGETPSLAPMLPYEQVRDFFFAQPGRILTQLARMPDGRTYLWVARTVTHRMAGYGMPGKTFAVALGCDLRHADRLVYSKGLDLTDPEAATPIGLGRKVCERHNCPQRAFPAIGRPLAIDEKRRDFAPYLADDK